MTRPFFLLLNLLVWSLAIGHGAPASAREPAPRTSTEHDGAQLDCAMLRRQPMPGMSVEECEAMKASHANLMGAVATPGGERPGDDAMTCDELMVEMKSMNVTGVSEQTAQEAQAAGEDLKATQERGTAMAATMAARQTAATAAASAGPNAVQGAVAAAQLAEQQALARNATREMQSARSRAMAAKNASARELAANLQSNPRFARLMQLVMAKNCDVNDAPPQR